MSQQNPWSIKGIKSGNRETARELAVRHGVTIGELINNLIEEADTDGMVQRSIGQNMGQNTRLKNSAAAPINAFSGIPTNNVPAWGAPHISGDSSRLTLAMEALNRSLENVANPGPAAFPTGPNSFPATASIAAAQLDRFTQNAVETLINRVENNERNADKGFSQINTSLNDIKHAQETIADRLRRIEHDNPADRSLLALRSLEGALARVAAQVSETNDKASGLEKKFENEKSSRLSPADVERILSQKSEDIIAKFDGKFGDFAGRLEGVENFAAVSIEQTDKGITLLSQRIRDTEHQARNTNETLREALVDLSARLTQLEGQSSEGLKSDEIKSFENRFKELESKIAGVSDNINELIEATLVTTTTKLGEVASSINDRIVSSESDTLNAIENVSNQLVSTVHGLDDRLKAVEALNNGSRDNAVAMKLELGRITHAVNEQLNALEKREATFIDNAGKHINNLAEHVTGRLDRLESGSGENANAHAKSLAEELLQKQSEATAEFARKLQETDERLTRRLDERLGNISRDIQAAEDKAAAATSPLRSNFDQVFERLEQIEQKSGNRHTEVISPPSNSFDMGTPPNAAMGLHSAGDDFVNLNKAPEITDAFDFDPPPVAMEFDKPELIGGGFGTNDADFGVEDEFSQPTATQGFGADFDELANQTAFAEPIQNDEIGGIEAFPTELGEFDQKAIDEDWLTPIDEANVQPRNDINFLDRARQAAIEAAHLPSQSNQKSKKPKPAQKPNLASKVAADPSVFDHSSKPQKDDKKRAFSPLAMATVGALAIGTAVIGYNYTQNQKPVDQSELPASLKNGAAVNAISSAAPQMPPAVVDDGVPHAATAAAPTNAAAPLPAQIQGGAVTAPAAAPHANLPALKPVAPKVPPIAAHAPVNNTNQLVAVNPAQGKLRPNTTRAAVPPLHPQVAAPTKTSTTAPVARIASATAPANTGNARQLYEQALQKQQAGDRSAANQLLTRAAEAGETRAQNRLARMYERGDGVTRDLAQARVWTERAAAAGSREAQHNLGVYYAESEGTGRDLNRAAENFRRAARRGLADSQFNLAAMAEQGLGAAKNEREAYFWYNVASKNGDTDAARKAAEVGARITAADKAAEDRRIASFRPETGGPE